MTNFFKKYKKQNVAISQNNTESKINNIANYSSNYNSTNTLSAGSSNKSTKKLKSTSSLSQVKNISTSNSLSSHSTIKNSSNFHDKSVVSTNPSFSDVNQFDSLQKTQFNSPINYISHDTNYSSSSYNTYESNNVSNLSLDQIYDYIEQKLLREMNS